MIYGCNFAQQACIWWQPPRSVCQCVCMCVTRERSSAKSAVQNLVGMEAKKKKMTQTGNRCIITLIEVMD